MPDLDSTFVADTRICMPGGFALFMLRCRGSAPPEDIEMLLSLGLIAQTPVGPFQITQKGRDLTDPHPMGLNEGSLLSMSCILHMQGIGPLEVMRKRAESVITPDSFLPDAYICKFQSRLAELAQHGLTRYKSDGPSAFKAE